ncbi:MAG: hypothetical protein U0894_15230 [Pirellulales bacterium]
MQKEVFVVDSVFDKMMQAMERAGAGRLNAAEVAALTRNAIIQVGDDKHDAPAEFLGQDATVLARGAGKSVPDSVKCLFGETGENNPFVSVEQMMPFLPFVRVKDVDEAIARPNIMSMAIATPASFTAMMFAT